MAETFLNKAQLTGLTRDARRTEILRAKTVNDLDVRVTALESGGGGGGVTLEQVQDDLGNTSLLAGTSLTKTYNDVANTITLDVDAADFATSGHTHGGTYQPLDADLTTIAAAGNGSVLAATTASYTGPTRIPTVSMFGSPVTGTIWNNALNATANATLAGAANRIELSPVIFPVNFTIDQLSTRCTTGVAASTIKIVVYASGTDGYPAALLKETAALSTATTNTTQTEAWSYTFTAGTLYWVGVRHSATATMRAVAVGATPNLGFVDQTGSPVTTLRRTLTYATAATNPWAFVSGDRTQNIAPTAIFFRAA